MRHVEGFDYHKLLAAYMQKHDIKSFDLMMEDVPKITRTGMVVLAHAQADRLTIHLFTEAEAQAFVAAHQGIGAPQA
jgi:hypothetical protein